jgi:hypothetical protein
VERGPKRDDARQLLLAHGGHGRSDASARQPARQELLRARHRGRIDPRSPELTVDLFVAELCDPRELVFGEDLLDELPRALGIGLLR